MSRWLTALPLLSWGAIMVATALDPGHDPLAHYLSWLIAGPWGHLATAGIVGLVVATALVALRLRRRLAPGLFRDGIVTALGSAAVLGLATLVLPSRGVDEPLWRTLVHLGLAVASYAGLAVAALGMAFLARKGEAPRVMIAWAAAFLGALLLLGIAAAVVRLSPWSVELRGGAQLLAALAAAGWLAEAARVELNGLAGRKHGR